MVQPPKNKKRRISADSEYISSGDSDGGYEPKPPTKKVKANRKKPTKRKVLDEKASDHDEIEKVTATHPASLHKIVNAKAMREALLQWYSGVHENRGMPWRKAYDPHFTREERSQRAYEVCSGFFQVHGRILKSIVLLGVDIRGDATTDSSRNCHPLL